MTYKQVLKLAFRVNTVAFILSPWIFGVLRLAGVIKTEYDWLVFTVLLICSLGAVFLNFGEDR